MARHLKTIRISNNNAIKNSLNFLVLSSGDGECVTRIIDVETTPGTRFNYQGAGKPIVEDAKGDSCIWEVSLEVVPVPAEAKSYLMRWTPSISSFTEKDFEESFAEFAKSSNVCSIRK